MKELLELIKQGGKIVSTAQLSNLEIAQARADRRIYVDEDGFGFVAMDVVKEQRICFETN